MCDNRKTESSADMAAALKQTRAEYFNLVSFVPARNRNVGETDKQSNVKKHASNQIAGTHARKFYEELLLESSDLADSHGPSGHKRNTCSEVERNQRSRGHVEIYTAKHTSGCSNSGSLSNNQKHMYKQREKCASLQSRRVNQFLSAAEAGDVRRLEGLMRSGVDVDVQDLYGWTALHCAAHAGHIAVVQYLADYGASVEIQDKQGMTPFSLAKQAKHTSIATLLKQLGKKSGTVVKSGTAVKSEPAVESETAVESATAVGSETAEPVKSEGSVESTTDLFFCSVCQSNVSNSSKLSHETSTVHLFNRKLKPKEVNYFVSPANVGYQMMKKSGWNESKGLGPDGQGQKYPIKTVLKRDRECLGSDQAKGVKAKVSHFDARDVSALEHIQPKASRRAMTAKTLSKRARKAKERRDKHWERSLRQYFNSK